MSSAPYWITFTKDFELALFIFSFNMAAKPLTFESLGIDCNPSLKIKRVLMKLYETTGHIATPP